MQFSLFDDGCNAGAAPQKLALPGADVTYIPGWLGPDDADALYASLASSLNWSQDTIKLFGKPVKIPRLQAWYGDAVSEYSYSGLTMVPRPWTADLLALKTRCENTAGCEFNSVLANWYRHGQDSMGMHADDEKELGVQPVIASVTLGEARPFLFRHRSGAPSVKVSLEHGSLLIMKGDTQRNYLHGINKTTRHVDGRINLTFRFIYPAVPEQNPCKM